MNKTAWDEKLQNQYFKPVGYGGHKNLIVVLVFEASSQIIIIIIIIYLLTDLT